MTKEKLNSPKLYSAMQFAFSLHGQDARKGTNIPYMAHLLSVCGLVQQDGGSENEAIAALLHDALEDKADQINPQEISEKFGGEVLEIVQICTDTPPDYHGGPKPCWRDRKEKYLKHVSTVKYPTFLRVTVADKIDNARAILLDYQYLGEKLWMRFNASKDDLLWYYESCLKAYKTAGFHGPLLKELRKLIVQLGNIIRD